MAIAKRTATVDQGGPGQTARVTTWMQEHKFLHEYLTAATFSDGSPRTTATLTIMCGDTTGVKVVLNDRAEGMSLWATGDDPQDALEVLEAILNLAVVPWKADKRPQAPGGKKK